MARKKEEKQEKLPKTKKEGEKKETKVKQEKEVKKKTKEEKQEVKEEKKPREKKKAKAKAAEEKLLVPLDDYIKAAVHLGTRAITPGMRQFVYRRRADGIAVLNTKRIDAKIEAAASFLSQYAPEQIVICCKREAGYEALESFGAAIGARIFKRYPAGLITNPNLEDFFEPSVLLVIDPWLDKNALRDAIKLQIPTIALCDTNNPTEYIDFIVPCNNKTSKSIGLILYVIAKLYLSKRGEKKKLKATDFYQLEEKAEEKTEEEKTEEKFESLAKRLRKKR